MGLDSKRSFSPPTILLGFPICPRRWDIPSKSFQRCATAAPVALFWGDAKSLQMVTAAMELKDACSLEEEL